MKTLLARFKLIDPVKSLRDAKARASDRRKKCFDALHSMGRDALVQQRHALAVKWVNTRSPKILDELIVVETRLLIVHNVEQGISQALLQVENDEIKAQADLIGIAFGAVSAAIDQERREIEAADERRSEELGVTVNSARALDELGRRADSVVEGQSQLKSRQPDLALAALFTVVGDGQS